MPNARRTIPLVLTLLAGVIFIVVTVASAQDDDAPPSPPAPSDPAPGVDWSQIVLPPHEDMALPDAPAVVPESDEMNSPPPAANPITYAVQSGDTLFRIALRFGVSTNALAAENQIADPRRISVGQVLRIPTQNAPVNPPPAVPSPAPAPVPSADGVYAVQSGDTMFHIARRFGVSVDALTAVNGITNPSFIRVGQLLKIPGAAPAPTSPPPAPNPAPTAPLPGEGTVYVVQHGDTLYMIARQFGIAMQTLTAVNNITNPALIYPGQKLIISTQANASSPTPPPTEPDPSSPSPQSQFIWPSDSRRIVKYYQAGHGAIDIVLPTGSSVYAMAAGKVEFAGWNPYGYGNLIVVDHGDSWRTLYAHNSDFQVKTGDAVAQGDVIAQSGSTGNSTMPHIHLEMMLNYKAVNPCAYLPGGC